MSRVLLTAFEPYDRWKTNSSWLTLMALTSQLPAEPKLVTRRYPVDFSTVQRRLGEDLIDGIDAAIHLGQAPGSSRIQFESIAVNIGGSSHDHPDTYRPLTTDGPVAYRSALPLEQWSSRVRAEGIPAHVSYHAGTYLCNATLYYSHYLAERRALPIPVAFIHLPVDYSQVVDYPHDMAAMPLETMVRALQIILSDFS